MSDVRRRGVSVAGRVVAAVAAAAVVAVLLASTTAAAQGAGGIDRPDVPPLWQGVGGFALTLLVGGIVLGVAPRYVDRIVDRVHDDPVRAFVWGVGVLALVIGLVFLLVITLVGAVIAVPLLVGFLLLGIVGNALGYLAVLDGTVGDRRLALVGGAVLAGVTSAIPILGDLVGFVVGSLGVGAMVLHYRA